ncbi:calcium-binding protein [uncultured Methylobacterium sp.]|jgi:hypothetical protein|uniref:calcium-binding protein n=1 Tax=uncultured Methylobacterium sp. TaxID=157278 RepID=UPI00261E2573|nr:calcium-binding protein [uncultured Methylobacterium sp.]
MSVSGNTSEIVAIASSSSDVQTSYNNDLLIGDEANNDLRSILISQSQLGGSTYVYRNSVNIDGNDGNDYITQQITGASSDESSWGFGDNDFRFMGGDGNDTIIQTINLSRYKPYSASFDGNNTEIGSTGPKSSGKDHYESTVYMTAEDKSVITYLDNTTNYTLGSEGGSVATRFVVSAKNGQQGSSTIRMRNTNVSQNGSDSSDRLSLDISLTSDAYSIINFELSKMSLYGKGGNDHLSGSLTMNYRSYIVNSYFNMYGGDGDDIIDYNIDFTKLSGGGKFAGSTINITGDGGRDVVNISLGQNRADLLRGAFINVDGGEDYDVLNINSYSTNRTPTFVDFSNGYDTATLGMNVRGFEAVSVSASVTADTILGGQGNDTINGGFGAPDSMVGGLGDDTYYVDNTADIVNELSGQGTDTIITSVDLSLSDSQSIERLIAGTVSGGLSLSGNLLANTIVGGEGADTLIGGEGSDRLTGGGGRDTFRYRTISEAGLSTTRDVIRDFVRGEDVVDLTAIQAVAGSTSDQAFSFIGTGAYTGQAGELRATQNGSVAVLQGDINGDRRSDFQIYLANITDSTLQASDFLL